jgi:hypothetical protein
VQEVASYPPNVREGRIDYILRDIDIKLWSKVKVKAILERETRGKVISEGPKRYIKLKEIAISAAI